MSAHSLGKLAGRCHGSLAVLLAAGLACAIRLMAHSQQTPLPNQQASQPTARQQLGQTVPGSADHEARAAEAQQPLPTEFQSHGMEYETLTKNGITVMFASIPPHVKEYHIVQVTVTNGSLVSWTVKPSDFTYIRQNGPVLNASSADEVVSSLLDRASASDVVKLQLLYEDTIYGLTNFRATNGYEQRREAGMTQFVNLRFKAAAAASAITLAPIKLKPGDSTDGAVFFESKNNKEKTLGPGRFVAKTCGEIFVFEVYGELRAH